MNDKKKKVMLFGVLVIALMTLVIGLCLLSILGGRQPHATASEQLPVSDMQDVKKPPESPVVSAEPPVSEPPVQETPVPEVPEPEEELLYAWIEGGVDLRWFLPEAEFNILFASDENVTGSPLYPAVPMLELRTAKMLKEAAEAFKADGYTIKICDAYRPVSAQFALWNTIHDNRYIADPSNGGSWHQAGKAIDMTLVDDETGEELEMPTPMHEFSAQAGRYAGNDWTEEAEKNVAYMTGVMESIGFKRIRTEWWHFERSVPDSTPFDGNVNIESLEYITADEMAERFSQIGITPWGRN